MSRPPVVAVGPPQAFKVQIAHALDTDPEDIRWVPTVTAAEEMLGERNGSRTPGLLVLSPEVKDVDALGMAEVCARTSPATVVILLRDQQLNGLLPAAMRAGIRDVVDLSRGTEELREAVVRGLAWSTSLRNVRPGADGSAPGDRGVLISVFSSKGGTGKTFLACNLAAAISRRTEKETALVDLDLDMGDCFSYWGQEASHTVQDLITLRDDMNPASVKAMGTELADHLWCYGTLPDPAAESVAGGVIGRTLRTIRNSFAYTIVDASADYSDQALAAFDSSDLICLISGLDVVGIKHLSKALETLMSIGLSRERFRIVINRADSKVGLSTADVERVMRVSVDALIPSSRQVPASLNKGRPVYLDAPRSDVSKSIDALAASILGVTQPAEEPLPRAPKRRLFAGS
ncbi:MAG: AAA family ATPase [Actinomycetota bacterium]